MKKIYTLAVAALTVLSANAASDSAAVSKTLSSQNRQEVKCAVVEKPTTNKSLTRDGEEWISLGEGIYREGIFASVYKVDSQEIPVVIEQNSADPTQYRMVNPYANWEIPFSDVTYDATGTYYVYFTTVEIDGATYWCFSEQGQQLGVEVENLGSADLCTQLGDYVGAYGWEAVAEAYGCGKTILGTYDPEKKVFGNMPYQCVLDFESTSGQHVNTEALNLWLHYSTIEEGSGYSINKKNLIAMMLEGGSLEPYDPFSEYELISECDMFNSIFENLYEEALPEVRTVSVYEEKGVKGSFLIANAWGEWNLTGEEIPFEIDARNPDYVMLPYQETGYTDDLDGLGACDIISTSQYYINVGNTIEDVIENAPEEVFKLDATTKRITIPASGILYAFENDEYYQYIENPRPDSDPWLQLPADYELPSTGAVSEIGMENVNGPVEYYTIDGYRVNTPAAGQLVIRRQGSKVSKLIVK